MKRKTEFLLALMLVTTLAYAHQGMSHVKGTVTKISESSITVKTTSNTMAVVTIGAQTKFSKGGAAVALKDLKVGDRVIIHAHKTGQALNAETVQIGISSHQAKTR